MQQAQERRRGREQEREENAHARGDDCAALERARNGFVVVGAHGLRHDRVERHERSDTKDRDIEEIQITERNRGEHTSPRRGRP